METHTGSQAAQGEVQHAQAARQLLVDAVKQFQASQAWPCMQAPHDKGSRRGHCSSSRLAGLNQVSGALVPHLQAHNACRQRASGRQSSVSLHAVIGQRQLQASCWGSQVQTGLAMPTQPPGRDRAAAAESHGDASALHTCHLTRDGVTVVLCL